jgi:hypothetical protein
MRHDPPLEDSRGDLGDGDDRGVLHDSPRAAGGTSVTRLYGRADRVRDWDKRCPDCLYRGAKPTLKWHG